MNPLLDPKTVPGFHNVGRNPHDFSSEELKEGGLSFWGNEVVSYFRNKPHINCYQDRK